MWAERCSRITQLLIKFSPGGILPHKLHDAHKMMILLHNKRPDINKKHVFVIQSVSSWVSMQCNLKKLLKSARKDILVPS